MERRCHYEVLGVDRGCSADEIKSAYRKLALQRHPDKLVRTGVSEADANAQFQELGQAYEVLSDPKERAWYDSHRSQILFADPEAAGAVVPDLFTFFSTTVFSGYSDSGKGFYKVYGDVFNKIYSNELSFARKLGLGIDAVREAPAMGNLKSDYAQVTAFYNHWLGFGTVMDFCWMDQYDVTGGPNRKLRRLMEEDNKKQRRKAKREYNETVRGLAEFVKKRDTRVREMVMKKEKEREMKKKEEREKKKRLEKEKLERAMTYEEPEWAKAVEEEEDEEEEEEEERKRNELYCVVCGKKFKSEKQWKNHEQSKKHKDKVAEFRESIVDEEDVGSEVDDLGEQMREGLEIGEEGDGDGVGVSGGEDEFYDFGDEIRREKADDEDDDDDDEMELLQAMAARHKSRERVDNDDEEEEEDDDGEDDEMELLKAMAARQKSRENILEEVGVEEDDSESDDEMDVLEAMVAGKKSRKNAASKVEVEDPLVTGVDVDNDSNGVESIPMEYENRKPSRRKAKNKKSGAETKRVDMNDISNDQSEAGEIDNSDIKESTSDSVVEDASSNAKQDDQIARKKKSSKQTIEKKKENVKKEAIGKSKSSSKGKRAKATSKNTNNACEACGEEFGSRNQLHKHLGDTGHASLKM